MQGASSSLKILDYSSDDEPCDDRLWLFLNMGFENAAIQKALQVCGKDAPDSAVIDFILALQHSEDEPEPEPAEFLRQPEESLQLRLSQFQVEQIPDDEEEEEEEEQQQEVEEEEEEEEEEEDEPSTLATLKCLGYSERMALRAIESCGTEEIDVLVDFIAAHADDFPPEPEPEPREAPLPQPPRKRTRVAKQPAKLHFDFDIGPRKSELKGFGVPGEPIVPRSLTPLQSQLPYFYFENVRSMPRGTWDSIKNQLYGIDPEFVCAKHFSVSRRPRGYVHNLDIESRVLIRPIPAKTIHEFFPASVKFIPDYDTRTQLHCINTLGNSASIAKQVEGWAAERPLTDEVKGKIVFLCKKWNLVWTAPGVCSSLEAHEVERALGYDENHTRGAITSGHRHRSLGNAFQVDVVGYHLSVLKPIYPNGIRVLSLFSGIGGAEVALHRAGIRLKFLVSVESEPLNRKILATWWQTSGQTGEHRILNDVEEVTKSKLAELTREAGGCFDLVIGGSPCNNLSGNNRASRTGLGGEHSSLFFEFARILNMVRMTNYASAGY